MIPGSTTKLTERSQAVATTIPVLSVTTDLILLTGTGASSVTKLVPNFGGGFSGVVIIANRSNATVTIAAANMVDAANFAILTLKTATLIFSKQLNKWLPGAATA